MLILQQHIIRCLSGLLSFLLTNTIFGQTKVFDKVIAADGTGDYTSVAYAISLYSNSRKVFFIKNGVYKEKILISSQKTNISLIGESRDGVIFTYDDYAGKSASSQSTAESYTFRVEGNGFYAENITFQNTATQAQAVAIYTRADTVTFKNCRFLGYQDTHFADKGRQYFLKCETRGDVDFIFGDGAVFYDQSVIVSRSRKGGYITAPADAKVTSPRPGGGTNYHGILIKNSEIIAEQGLDDNSCYIGRPWNSYASSVFYRCRLGNHIKPEGWSVWTTDPLKEGYTNHHTAFFAEFESINMDGAPADISQRVSWSKQLFGPDTAMYSLPDYFLGWDPTLKTNALPPPENLRIQNDSLFWSRVEGSRGYVILKNGSVTGFSVSEYYFIGAASQSAFAVKSVNAFGALSNASVVAQIVGIAPTYQTKEFPVYISSGYLYLPENIKTEIYNITGTLVKTIMNRQTVLITDLENGLYILKILIDNNSRILISKILVSYY